MDAGVTKITADRVTVIEREVKRANREMMQQVSKMNDMQKIEHLTRRSSELLAEMRRMERENQKNKKRGDALQKEKDANRTELSKTVGLKDKLEKLCRELQKDNNKYKVWRPRIAYRVASVNMSLANWMAERQQNAPGQSQAQHSSLRREIRGSPG